MIEVYKFEGNNEEECRVNCLDELDVYNNEIITKEYNEEDKYVLEVIKKQDIEKYIQDYIKELSEKMNIDMKANIFEEENVFFVRINSKNNSILIGKEGKTLNSIQYLLRKSISNQTGFNINVNLDVSNYKKKIETKLDPMNSYKRRIVHSIASNYYNIETNSVGEEPNRCTIIRYVEK